jgi:hypothetical protein
MNALPHGLIKFTINARHCERSEATQGSVLRSWLRPHSITHIVFLSQSAICTKVSSITVIA